jgi:hypothetical protein
MDYNDYFSTQENKEAVILPDINDIDIILPSRIKPLIDYNDIIGQGDKNVNFEKEIITDLDRTLNIPKSAAYGWNMGVSSLLNFGSSIPGTADRFRDWFFKKRGENPIDDDWLEHGQDYLEEKSLQFSRNAELIGEPHGFRNRLVAEIAQVPGAIVQYIPAMIGTGKYGLDMKSFLRLPLSFAATDAIRVADDAPLWGTDSVSSEALKGFGTGLWLGIASKVKSLPVKSLMLFSLGFTTAGDGFFPTTRADSEKRVAAGITWAALGAMDRVFQGKEPREKIIKKLEGGKKVAELTKEEIESIPEDIKTAYQLFEIKTYIAQTKEIIKEGKKQGGEKLTTQEIADLEARVTKFEHEQSRYQKVLFTLEEQSGVIHGLDQRPIEQVWETTQKNLETAKDLPDIAIAQKGMPGKYAADWYAGRGGNLLYKRLVDEVAVVHNKIENLVQNILYSPEKPLKGHKIERKSGESIMDFFQRNNYALTTFIPALTARRYLNSVKGTEGALTKIEILARKDINKADQVIQAGFKVEYDKAGKAKIPNEDYTKKNPDGTFKYEVTDKELGEIYKLDKEQIEAYRSLRKGDREGLDYFNKHAESVGYDRVQIIPNHMQRNWDGTFKLWVWTEGKIKNAEPDAVYSANTKWGIDKLQKDKQKEFPKGEFSIVQRKKLTEYNSNLSMFYDNINLLKAKNLHEAAEIMQLSGKELLQRKNQYAKYGKTRRDVKGYIGSVEKTAKERVNNYLKAYTSRITGGVQAIEYAKLNEFHRALFNKKWISKNFYNTKIFSKQYLDNFTGSLPRGSGWFGGLDKILEKLTERFGDTGLSKAIGGLNLTQLHLRLMWWNFRFAASQGIQPYQMVIPKLVGLKADGYSTVDIGKVMVKSQKALFKPDKLEQDAIRTFGDVGLVTAQFLREFIDHQSNFSTKVSPLNIGTISGYVSGRNLVATIEMNSRLNAGLMFYHFFKEAGLNHNTAKYRAAYMANKVMVEYHLAERALMYGTAGAGFLGKLSGLFKTFQNNYFSQLALHVKDGKRTGDYSGTAAYAISMITVAGLTGVIAIEQADSLIRMISPAWEKISGGKRIPTLTEYTLTSDLPLFFKVGVPSAIMGGDMTATLAAPGIAVTDLFSIPSLDYLGLNPVRLVAGQYFEGKKKGIVQAIFGPRNGLLLKILTDMASPSDVEEFYKLAAPTSFHGYIEAYYAGVDNPFLEFLGNDRYAIKKYLPYIDPKKNRGTFHRDKADWIRRFLSLRPLDEVLLMKLIYNQTLIKKDATASLNVLLDLAISESFSDWGVGDIPLWVYDMAWEVYGIDGKSFNEKIKNRYKRNFTGIQERTTDKKSILNQLKIINETIENYYYSD